VSRSNVRILWDWEFRKRETPWGRPKWVCRYQQGGKEVWLEVKCWSVVRVDDNYVDARFSIDMEVILDLKYVK
jgi:hypothetical protein